MDSSSDDDDRDCGPSVKKSRKIILRSDVDENATSTGKNDNGPRADCRAYDSIATILWERDLDQDHADEVKTVVVSNGDHLESNYDDKTLRVDNNADEDDDVLPGASNDNTVLNEDVDSDETDFEDNDEGVGQESHGPLPATLGFSCNRFDDDDDGASDSTNFDPSDSEDTNFESKMKNEAPDSFDPEIDTATSIPPSCNHFSLDQGHDFEGPFPPVYNPYDVRKQKWHGDVKRTVAMFNETIQQMPMPDDEGYEDIKLPPGLVELYRHQRYALRWMTWREGQFPGGGILADEMGLGKTIEVIALIMKSKWEAAKKGSESEDRWVVGGCIPSRTTLIVSPLSCTRQWREEIEAKGKNLSVYMYHGPNKLSSAASLADFDVVITTYHTIAYEIPKEDEETETPKPCFSVLKRVRWLRIVLDEAHYIRNPKTNSARAITQLEARHRWAVTGTPIHNKPEDFYSMCAFLRLTPFDDRDVWNTWIGLENVNLDAGAQQRLHILGKALILRRTKLEVGISNDSKLQRIPPKTVDIISVELSSEERLVYDTLMGFAQKILKEFIKQKEQRESQRGRTLELTPPADSFLERLKNCRKEIRFSHIFTLFLRLRQCAVAPYLINTMIQAEEIGVSQEDIEELEPEHIISTKNPVLKPLYISAKFQQILDDIDELRGIGMKTEKPMDKVIIVSSWTSSLDLIFEHLKNKSYSCVFITGRETMDLRMQNMSCFNKNRWRPQILLLSLMAGGVGLNLFGANHVFFMEPHWNPQHELQAQDRVHRFGQKKDVFIHRYIAENTIESRIMHLQAQKLELANGLLSNTKKKRGPGISLEEMMHLFGIHDDNKT